MECSNSIDKLGKLLYKRGEHMYTYKGIVNTLPFMMVDYILAVAECGLKSVSLNVFINHHHLFKFELMQCIVHDKNMVKLT